MSWVNEFKRLFSEGVVSLPDIAEKMKENGTWYSLISYLKQEEYGTDIEWAANPKQTHQLIFGHEITPNSIIDQFDNNIDLNLTIDSTTSSWNESVTNAIGIWAQLNNSNLTWKILDEEDSITISLSDLKNADAALSFNSNWVKPIKNVDNQTYENVRDRDKVNSVLKNSNNLQFTRTQNNEVNKFLRLIMPKYTRRVEIEDLNRNFWVIGQTITGISSYLLSNNSPLASLLNSILSEIVQLWENVMYLWAEYGILSASNSHIRICYLPLPNNTLQPYRKYDNFTYNDGSSALDRVKFLADKYPKDSLVIVPYSRTYNYEHNYYSHYYIRRIIFFNRPLNQWTSRYICDSGMKPFDEQGRDQAFEVVFRAEQEENITTLSGDTHAAARVVPHIAAEWQGDYIHITNFVIDFIDIGSKTLKWQLIANDSTYTNWTDKPTEGGKQVVNGSTYYYVNAHIATLTSPATVTINSAYYLGDCVSCRK